MMKKILTSLITITSVCFFMPAHALLNIQLTQGVASALPVAVVPFLGDEALQEDQRVSQVIHLDLSNSGQFKVLSEDTLPALPHKVMDINLPDWQSADVQDVVVGSVTPLDDNQYKVHVSLVSVFHKRAGMITPDAILLDETFTVPEKQLHALGHHISDVIYEKLTGVKGIFSTRIAYIYQRPDLQSKDRYQLIVADYDGNHPHVLVHSNEPLMSPVWSPKGDRVAFVSFQHKLPAIYLADLSTGKLTQLTEIAGINGAPAWSPDGKTVAVVLSTTGQAKIYLKHLDTGKLTQLTYGPSIDTEPSFSPDGKSLVFTSNRGGSPQIYQYHFDNQKCERLTYDGPYNASATFSPDGKFIAFLHEVHGAFNIATEALDTDRLRVLTNTGHDESPKFAPNGKMIIYATRDNGKTMLALVSADGRIHVNLPATVGNVQGPAWGPY